MNRDRNQFPYFLPIGVTLILSLSGANRSICRILFFLAAAINSTNAQRAPIWQGLERGKFDVGYKEVIFLDSSQTYTFGNYEGPKPFFLSVWYPGVDKRSKSYMKYRDYSIVSNSKKLNSIVTELNKHYKQILIKDAICKDIKDRKNLEYDDNLKRLFEEILEAEVVSKRNLVEMKGVFPCIVYHHGAQSTPFDNTAFCEYMTSHGFIVVSSNYLWPNEKEDHLGHSNHIADLSFVVERVQALFKGKDLPFMVGVGHSWGAQALILHDTVRSKPFKKIISFHTTLEDKPVDHAKKMWPTMMSAFYEKSHLMTTPTFLFAPQFRIKDGFDYFPFRENKVTPYTLITVNTDFLTHDGLILLGNLRAPFAEKYNLNDQKEVRIQSEYFKKILKVSKLIIESELSSPELQGLIGGDFTLGSINSSH